ncbi:hypothetical protein GCM10020001_008200 [Nonomuraea salmonea]
MTSISFDVEKIRKDFPVFSRELPDGRPLVYLDSGNSSQKPNQVIETMREHLALHYSNVGRAMHVLGAESTDAYEGARDKVAGFIGAPAREEVVFTKNASEALNLLAYSFGNPANTDPPASRWGRATRSSSRRWSTTPTSCRGSCSRSAPARR